MDNPVEIQTTEAPEVEYKYGAMSSKFKLKAKHKLTAYATMVLHYDRSAHLMVIYSPESSKEDRWANITGRISERLDEIFGGPDAFDKYVEAHIEDIRACCNSIQQLI